MEKSSFPKKIPQCLCVSQYCDMKPTSFLFSADDVFFSNLPNGLSKNLFNTYDALPLDGDEHDVVKESKSKRKVKSKRNLIGRL